MDPLFPSFYGVDRSVPTNSTLFSNRREIATQHMLSDSQPQYQISQNEIDRIASDDAEFFQLLCRPRPGSSRNPRETNSASVGLSGAPLELRLAQNVGAQSQATADEFPVDQGGTGRSHSGEEITAEKSYPKVGKKAAGGTKTSKKRPATAARQAVTKKKKPVVEISDSEESEDGDERGGGGNWNDSEVQSLIQLKGEMQPEFRKSAGKQGVNTWDKLCMKMVAVCPGFNRTTKACKKKFAYLQNQYRTDVRHNKFSGNDRKMTCKYFAEFDEAFGSDFASVQKQVHLDARGTCDPAYSDSNTETPSSNTTLTSTDGAAGDQKKESTDGVADDNKKETTTGEKQKHRPPLVSKKVDQRRSSTDRLCSILEDMASSSQRVATNIEKSFALFEKLDVHIGKLVDSLSK